MPSRLGLLGWRSFRHASEDRPMVKKILIAIDGSDHAGKAVAFGADIAAKYGAELLLVHVLLRQELPRDLQRIAEAEHLVPGDGRAMPAAAAAGLPVADLGSYLNLADGHVAMTRDVLHELGEKILDNAETVAREHGAGKIVKRIEDGKPIDRILQLARSEKVDLVVTGARGLSDVKALILGSVSHKLAQMSPVTCITVR
jgi:nucleotide-binding universal stress UspA family protein